MTKQQVLTHLKSLADPKWSEESMSRFGITTDTAYGVSIPKVRKLAKEIGKNHELAQELWDSNIHEARILASIVDEPAKVTEKQMDAWTSDFNSWDICDQCCANLYVKTPFAHDKAKEYSKSELEFVKRTGFSLMAYLAVHDKKAADEAFVGYFPIIEREANDGRNFVKKAVNWALRQIGKRNLVLHKLALESAKRISQQDSPAARWIAANAIRELEDEKIIAGIKRSS
jgi:3-methyladenine DNA glycosylase AlkD